MSYEMTIGQSEKFPHWQVMEDLGKGAVRFVVHASQGEAPHFFGENTVAFLPMRYNHADYLDEKSIQEFEFVAAGTVTKIVDGYHVEYGSGSCMKKWGHCRPVNGRENLLETIREGVRCWLTEQYDTHLEAQEWNDQRSEAHEALDAVHHVGSQNGDVV